LEGLSIQAALVPIIHIKVFCRLLCQLRPDHGVLILVLPLRCVDSPLVGRKNFEDLLTGLGAIQVMAPRVTPKLIFYVLKTMTPRTADKGESTWTSSIKSSLRRNLSQETRALFSRDIESICSEPLKYFALKFPPSWLV
jgi:protoheme ferro-lyase